ncbi:MAG: histidine phosphatase family protein [Pedobacter sp.]
MKQLLLIRHGKSEWGNAHLSDFDRPLNPRGHRNAPEMALRLVRKNLVPEITISSPALRALTTASHFEHAWHRSIAQIKQDSSIYEAAVPALLHLVNNIENKYNRAALFGHNPGFTDLANYLTDANIDNLPTCGIVILEFTTDHWSEIAVGTGRLLDFDYPKKVQ